MTCAVLVRSASSRARCRKNSSPPDVVTGCTQCEYLSRLYVGYRRMPEDARRRGQLMAFALQLWREHAAEHG